MITLNRIEPDRRSRDIRPGARVPVADPAWTLARQWWMGELDGHDGGAPLLVRFRLGESALQPTDGENAEFAPSSALADEIAQSLKSDWRVALHLGRQILAELDAWESGVEKVIVESGDPSGNFREMLEGMRRNRREFVEQFAITSNHPAARRVPAHDRLDGLKVLQAFKNGDRQVARIEEDSNGLLSTLSRNLVHEHSFDSVAGTHEVAIRAEMGTIAVRGATGPALHWSDLDLKNIEFGYPDQPIESMLSRLTFAGSPPARWWDLENAAMAWSAAPAGPSDLGQLLLAAGLSNQREVMWIAPFDVSANHIVWVGSLEVVDGFGAVAIAQPAPDEIASSWSAANGKGAMAILAEGPLLRGAALEQVVFGVDEMDNMLWAEERIAKDALGRGTAVPTVREYRDGVDQAALALRLSPPSNWFPYTVRDSALRLTPLARTPADRYPKTGLLPESFDQPPAAFAVHGAAVERRWILARSLSGARFTWSVRLRTQSGLQGSSGLAHDTIIRPVA